MQLGFSIFTVILLVLAQSVQGQEPKLPDNRLIICLLPLDHADARQLAATLAPLMSPQGSLVPYEATNTLIIKDRPSVVRMLIKAIKGEATLSACQNFGSSARDEKQ